MIRDITLGQYYPSESPLHRIDPRVKICAALAYIVILFVMNSLWHFVYATAVLGVIIAISRVPLPHILRGLKVIFFIILLTFVLNLFMYQGRVLVELGPLHITDVGLEKAIFMAARLILLIIGTSMLTFTTKPMELTDGFEFLMAPFKKMGAPTHEVAMMMSIALRFIPTLLEETDKIMKAQQARGADFESGNLIKRAKALVPILVPLFISAFRIAQDLAMAMEARCYHGGEGRTRMHEMKLKAGDACAIVLLVLFVASVIVWRIMI